MKILGIAGSLRVGSYNKMLIRTAVELAPDGMTVEPYDLEGIPLFNADVEAEGDPEDVSALKEAIRSADGLLIATPEYNHSIPGVLKNALDWASRPPKPNALDGKPVAIIGASPGFTGTVRAQEHLRSSLLNPGSLVMPKPELLVFRVKEKVDEEGKLIDEKTRELMEGFLEKFGEWVGRVSS